MNPQFLATKFTEYPEDLAGLCKLRIGDYRILYWIYPAKKLIRIYRIQHRSEIYRQL